jgi:hypothetical protein
MYSLQMEIYSSKLKIFIICYTPTNNVCFIVLTPCDAVSLGKQFPVFQRNVMPSNVTNSSPNDSITMKRT